MVSLVVAVARGAQSFWRGNSVFLFGSLPNVLQDPQASSQIRGGNIGQQFMPKLRGCGIDLRNDPMRSLSQVNGLATTIVRSRSARNPATFFEPMQQIYKRGLLNAESLGHFGLSQDSISHGKVQQCPPLGLAQSHRLETGIES